MTFLNIPIGRTRARIFHLPSSLPVPRSSCTHICFYFLPLLSLTLLFPHFLWLFQYLAKFCALFNWSYVPIARKREEKEKWKRGRRENSFNWLMSVCLSVCIDWASLLALLLSSSIVLTRSPVCTWCPLSCRCLRCMGRDGPCQFPYQTLPPPSAATAAATAASAIAAAAALYRHYFAFDLLALIAHSKWAPKLWTSSGCTSERTAEILIWGPLPPSVHWNSNSRGSRRSFSLSKRTAIGYVSVMYAAADPWLCQSASSDQ